MKISQCVAKLAKLAVFTNLLLTARLEFILGKQSPFFVTTQLAGSGSEAQSFYKLGDSVAHIMSPEKVDSLTDSDDEAITLFCHDSTRRLKLRGPIFL